MDLAGKTIVVTGASGNLGRAVCARLARDGARVVPFVHTKRGPEERAVELTDERSVEAGFDGIGLVWAFLVSRAAIRRFAPEGGRIVNVSAAQVASLTGIAGMSAYAAAKAGVIALTKAIAEEGAATGVRANCLALGVMRTPQNERAMAAADKTGWVKPEDVAEAIAFLCDPRSAAVNGAVVILPSR